MYSVYPIFTSSDHQKKNSLFTVSGVGIYPINELKLDLKHFETIFKNKMIPNVVFQHQHSVFEGDLSWTF